MDRLSRLSADREQLVEQLPAEPGVHRHGALGGMAAFAAHDFAWRGVSGGNLSARGKLLRHQVGRALRRCDGARLLAVADLVVLLLAEGR